MKKEVTINYSWNNEDYSDIPNEIHEQLENSAMERVIEMMNEGYTSGELCEEINEINYSGWWSINTKTL